MATQGSTGSDSILLAHAPRPDGLSLALQHRHIPDSQRPEAPEFIASRPVRRCYSAKQSAKVGLFFFGIDCLMTTITTPRLSLTRFVTDDWPFFLRLRQDPQVMRFMGEVLSEEALRSVFASRCADPGVYVLRNKRGDALGDIGFASA